MVRGREVGGEVSGVGLQGGAGGRPWNQVAGGLGVPYTAVREWLRRFARRADRAHAWLCGLLPRLVDDPVLPPGTATAAGDALAVLGAWPQQLPGRWPAWARISPPPPARTRSPPRLAPPPSPPGEL